MTHASTPPTGGPEAQPNPYKNKAIGLAVAAAVGGFLFGFDSSVINGAVDAIQEDFDIGSSLTGFVVAVALLGCAFGAWLGGKLADKFGRTRVMLVGAILFFVSSILSGLAVGVWDLILWRVLAGIGIGIASVIAPAYIAEIAPAAMRGRLGSLQQLAITLGIFAALLSDQLLQGAAGGASETLWLGLPAWRWMFMVAAIPAAVYGFLALRIPESPRYLIATGRREEAKDVLASTLGEGVDVEDHVVQIEHTIATDKKLEAQASLRGPRFGLLPVVWVGILLSVFQQFVGINVIFYYSTTLWQAVGFEESQSFQVSTFTSITNVLVTFIAIALIDKVGRRPLLLTGSIGMALTLGVMSLAFTQSTGTGKDVTLAEPWGVIALVAANLFVVFFGATWGPLVWVLLGEMFPNRIRAAALGVAAAAQWIANFAITVTFPPLLDHFGASIPYLMYAIFAALSFLFTLWKVPETKGVELEDMEGVTVDRSRRGTAAST
ncbi:sugar porter family MFS transporter [Cellulomonas sp. URHD0024]|uniref:sugar porter family MFS transporter n=1 Tax=Cellulomonas sp. URHD0024 TaxID=1302620 RepID=UPI00041147B9|nr:sugar porter family MFS transporter [Cellulomonas sp. URHD0024]